MARGDSSWSGSDITDVEIEIDINLIAAALLKNEDFINALASKVRKAQTKKVRSTGNVYGHWAQGR